MDRTIIPQGRPETCRDCTYLEIMASQPVCCRYPPQPSVIQVIDVDALTGKPIGKLQQHNAMPAVSLTGWCGEFKRANHPA